MVQIGRVQAAEEMLADAAQVGRPRLLEQLAPGRRQAGEGAPPVVGARVPLDCLLYTSDAADE